MCHPAHPGLAQDEEDFTGAIDDAGRLSNEDSEFSMLEDKEPEPPGSDTDELRHWKRCKMPCLNCKESIVQWRCKIAYWKLELLRVIGARSSECWVSPLAIEDGVKSELFQFIPKEDHPLMAHCIFGDKCVHSEMVSDVKSTGGAIFGLPAEFFLHSFNHFEEPHCWELLLSPNQKYTKFAPCLFPNMSNSECLGTAPQSQPEVYKTSLLVQTKAQGKTVESMEYYCWNGGRCSHCETSTSANTDPTEAAVKEVDDWELVYQNAFEGLSTGNGHVPPPPPPPPSPPFDPGAVPEIELEEAPSARGKARPKPKHKAKAMTTPD
ncbi:hypothetical protein EDC04DRAFT_2614949 [Pisolithus marmoratus]|nr:hypothetical protein EDC04DRAFT_2614949 [Pisolithus marmoratus]